jgi:hypothetical protein
MPRLHLLLLLALSQAADVRADDAQTLATIRAAVRENLTSIHSLELKFHKYDPETETEFKNWEWAISGNKSLLTREAAPDLNRRGNSRWWMSFDGTTGYYIDYEPTDKSKVRSLARTSEPYSNYDGLAVPLSLLNLRVLNADQTFLELLDRPTARLLGEEEVDGHPCWKVDLGTHTIAGKPANGLVAWFDPSVGYWARWVKCSPYNAPTRKIENQTQPIVLEPGQIFRDDRALEFDRFDDLALGGQRWFPTRYAVTGLGGRTYEVVFDDIQINPTIPDERFVPDLPVGTPVYDGTGPNQRSGYIGGEAGFAAIREQALAKAAEMSKVGPGQPLIDTRSEGWLSWNTALLAVSVLVAIVGGGYWLRLRSRG